LQTTRATRNWGNECNDWNIIEKIEVVSLGKKALKKQAKANKFFTKF